MTATRSGPGEFADAIGKEVRDALGRLRRMAVSLTSRALWQVTGHLLLDKRVEARDVEPFMGVGFYARPKAGNRVDAIVHFPNGAAYPAAIAFRDEDTRSKVAADLNENETQVHNDVCVVRLKANATIEVRTPSGATQPTIRATTYRTAEDSLIDAMTIAFAAINTFVVAKFPPPDPITEALTAALTVAWVAAVAAFKGGSSQYVTTVLRAQ